MLHLKLISYTPGPPSSMYGHHQQMNRPPGPLLDAGHFGGFSGLANSLPPPPLPPNAPTYDQLNAVNNHAVNPFTPWIPPLARNHPVTTMRYDFAPHFQPMADNDMTPHNYTFTPCPANNTNAKDSV